MTRPLTILAVLIALTGCGDAQPTDDPGPLFDNNAMDAGDPSPDPNPEPEPEPPTPDADDMPEPDPTPDPEPSPEPDPEPEPQDEACPPPPEGLPDLQSERQGRFERLRNFPSGSDLPDRDLVVYLPSDYDSASERRYPVLYMHDGQNLFDPQETAFGVEWGVDETVDHLTSQGLIEPWIVVGIANTARRIDEYTPDADPEFGGGGRGQDYHRLLVERIKPFIDARYRTVCGDHNTAVAGSSLGGLISFDLFQQHPGVFGRVAAVSPSLWWNNRSALQRFEDTAPALPMRLWLDGGSAEGEQTEGGASTTTINAAQTRDRALALGGRYGDTVGYLEVIGAPHNEAAWAARLTSILGFILSDSPVAERPATELSLHLYRPQLSVGEATDIEIGALHEGQLWLSWPPAEANLTLSPEGLAQLTDEGRLVALGEGTVTIRAQVAGATRETTLTIGEGNRTRVRFEVEAPPGTDAVHVSGSPSVLGTWDGVGVALDPQGGVLWATEIELPEGLTFEYKYTRGSWDTVEKNAQGQEISNRQGLVTLNVLLSDEVARWADR